MRKSILLALAFTLVLGLWAADKAPMPAQAQRGHTIFLHSTKSTACAACHQLAGEGLAVAPDLTNMATYGSVHVLVATIRMSMTENVFAVKTAEGTFPGVLKQKKADASEYWDLSQNPPVLRTLAAKEILSADRDTKWQHPPTAADYTPQEYADLIGFLKWAATGATKEITKADVGELQ